MLFLFGGCDAVINDIRALVHPSSKYLCIPSPRMLKEFWFVLVCCVEVGGADSF